MLVFNSFNSKGVYPTIIVRYNDDTTKTIEHVQFYDMGKNFIVFYRFCMGKKLKDVSIKNDNIKMLSVF